MPKYINEKNIKTFILDIIDICSADDARVYSLWIAADAKLRDIITKEVIVAHAEAVLPNILPFDATEQDVNDGFEDLIMAGVAHLDVIKDMNKGTNNAES